MNRAKTTIVTRLLKGGPRAQEYLPSANGSRVQPRVRWGVLLRFDDLALTASPVTAQWAREGECVKATTYRWYSPAGTNLATSNHLPFPAAIESIARFAMSWSIISDKLAIGHPGLRGRITQSTPRRARIERGFEAATYGKRKARSGVDGSQPWRFGSPRRQARELLSSSACKHRSRFG